MSLGVSRPIFEYKYHKTCIFDCIYLGSFDTENNVSQKMEFIVSFNHNLSTGEFRHPRCPQDFVSLHHCALRFSGLASLHSLIWGKGTAKSHGAPT